MYSLFKIIIFLSLFRSFSQITENMQWNKTQQRKSPYWQLSKEYRDVNDLFMQSFIGLNHLHDY